MEDLAGLAKTVDSCANFASSAADGIRSVGQVFENVHRGKYQSVDALQSMIDDLAVLTVNTTVNAFHVANRCQQMVETVMKSTNNDDYYDGHESEIEDMRGEITDVLTWSAKTAVTELNNTRLVQSSQKWKEMHRKTEKSPLFECKNCDGLREKDCLEKISDPNFEHIGPGEKTLAENLRLWCTSYGEEKTENLSKSAAVLLRFGRLYLHKASCGTTGMLQKLSFIRCTVLLHAARIRFERLRNVREEIHEELADVFSALFKSLLLASTGGQAGEKILGERVLTKVADAFSALCRFLLLTGAGGQFNEEILKNTHLDIGTALETSRIAIEKDLRDFDWKEQQNDGCKGMVQVEKMHQDRIQGVKTLNENMTKNYIELMQNIAKKCIQLMGKPPVRFALVGLGSMARKEITLYSDFEHAILLEDGCHSNDVMEYFRWFTVLFQIIVIGIGETIVPTVCVKSINNLYSDYKSEDCWFYDIVTSCGIAFDGMAPHSCATPLGKQIFSNAELDEGKGYPQELIKTTREMLVCLDSKDDLQGGYNLKDLLSCTCLVFGDEETYEKFRNNCKQILNHESAHTVVKQHAERIIQNPNPQVRAGYFDHRGFGKLNAKAIYYRPFSVLIGSLGKIHKVGAIATLDVLEALRINGAINHMLCHKLSYAFAVICEMRVRAYSQVKTQRRVFRLEDIHEMVGEEAEWVIKDMMQYLQDSIQKHGKAAEDGEMEALRIYNDQYVSYSLRNEVRNLYFRSQYEKAMEAAEESSLFSQDDEVQYWLFKSYYQAGHSEEKRAFWDRSERIYKRLTTSKTLEERVKAECHCIMAEIFATQKRFREAYETTKTWLLFYLNAGAKQAMYRHILPAMYKSHVIAAAKEMRPRDGEIKEFLQSICSQENPECRSVYNFFRSMTSVASSQGSESFGSLRDVVEEIALMARQAAEPRLLLKVIWAFQFNNRQWADAMRTADCLKDFPDISCSGFEYRAVGPRQWPQLSGICAVAEVCQVFYNFQKRTCDMADVEPFL